MGMAASQVRLLALTSRKHDNELQTMRLSNEKVALSNEMSTISKNYQNALNSKVLKWSNNAGATYVDLSYNNLMTPGTMNQYSPYLLTDQSGMVIVDEKYKKYAEMISENGTAGGDWAGVRTKVLSELTGIDASKIESYDAASKTGEQSKIELDKLAQSEPKKTRLQKTSNNELVAQLDKGSDSKSIGISGASDWADAFGDADAYINLGAAAYASASLDKVLDYIKNKLGPYFADSQSKFESAVEIIRTQYNSFITAKQDFSDDKSAGALQGNSSGYKLKVQTLINEILGAYGGESVTNSYGSTNYVWYDVESNAYKEWQTKHQEWQDKYDAAQKEYTNSVNSKSELLSSDEERQIAFYDAIFSSIAEKGWVYNSSVGDTDYLNQMLQNNIYSITSVNRSSAYDADTKSYKWTNEYDTDIASNNSHIVTVRDSDAANDALVEYEHKKSIINAKESRIDVRMKNLETELSAINQMIQGIETVEKDNIERTFGIFG